MYYFVDNCIKNHFIKLVNHLWKNCFQIPINKGKGIKAIHKNKYLNKQSGKQLQNIQIHQQAFTEASPEQIKNYSTDIAENLEGECLINSRFTRFQIDTGSDVTVISDKTYKHLKNKHPLIKVHEEISGADGNCLNVLGKTWVKIQIGSYITHTFILVMRGLVKECLIGLDFVNRFKGLSCTY